MKLDRLATFTLGVLVTAVLVGAVTLANAASDTTIKSCANKKTGVMRYISGGSCKKTERLLTWNQEGKQGANGSPGATGAKGDTGAAGTAGAKGDTGAAGTAGAKGEAGSAAQTIPTTTTTVPTQRVGDIGPGGGPIFYVDTNNIYPFTYLEAAPSNATDTAANCTIGNLAWAVDNTISGPLTSDTFGQGKNNTETLLAMCGGNSGTISPYEQIIPFISQGWFVPNIAELKSLINAEKFGHVQFSKPLRQGGSYPQTPYLMTSSIAIGANLSLGVPFWSWGYVNPTIDQPYNFTATTSTSGNSLRLIRMG